MREGEGGNNPSTAVPSSSSMYWIALASPWQVHSRLRTASLSELQSKLGPALTAAALEGEFNQQPTLQVAAMKLGLPPVAHGGVRLRWLATAAALHGVSG